VVRLTKAPVGFAGPVGLSKELPVLADLSVMPIHDAFTGGLEADLHYAHVEAGRDFVPWKTADLRVVKAGDLCSKCGKPLYEKKGNELGHIFKLGDKYTKSMNLSFLDQEGKARMPIMGCYGIGVDRTLASIIEEYHDADGILWPMSAAPYQAIIVPMKGSGPAAEAADQLALEMEALGLEVLVDDRDERPGVKFKDADLIGIPIRIVLGERNLPANVELKLRGEKEAKLVPVEGCAKLVADLVKEELAKLGAAADAAALGK
jgi:prolyl-tRNA synthetase